jgi:hypothetical protein
MPYTISAEGEKDRVGYATRADAIHAVIRTAPLSSVRATIDFEGSFPPATEHCEVRISDRSGSQKVWTITCEPPVLDLESRVKELEARLRNQESEMKALKVDKEERRDKKKKKGH